MPMHLTRRSGPAPSRSGSTRADRSTISRPDRRSYIRGGAAIAISAGAMTLSYYAFSVLAAHSLGPTEYGSLAAMLNLLPILGVISLALQVAGARHVVRSSDGTGRVEQAVLRVGRRASVGLGLGLAMASPIISSWLQFDSPLVVVMLALTTANLTMTGTQAGVLQGHKRWGPLALMYLVSGLPRIAIGFLFLAKWPYAMTAAAAVALGSCVPVAVGRFALRATRSTSLAPASGQAGTIWWETVHNAQALLAFLLIVNFDFLIARDVFGGREAGIYAAGLILTKAVTFIPQFIVVLAFPTMGADDAPLAGLFKGLAAIAGIGGVVVVAVGMFSNGALSFVGGSDYAALSDNLRAFALLGTVVSMLQLAVYGAIARQARLGGLVLWLGVLSLVGAGYGSSSVNDLVIRVLTVDSVILVLLLMICVVRRGSGAERNPLARM